MIVFGVILLVLAVILKIDVLSPIGLIVLIVGFVLLALGQFGHPVGGRRYWY
jgi:Family of unknown function (DUF6131)